MYCGVNIFSKSIDCGNNEIEYCHWSYCVLPYGTACRVVLLILSDRDVQKPHSTSLLKCIHFQYQAWLSYLLIYWGVYSWEAKGTRCTVGSVRPISVIPVAGSADFLSYYRISPLYARNKFLIQCSSLSKFSLWGFC